MRDGDVDADAPIGQVTRRALLVRGAQGAVALSGASLLAACGSGSSGGGAAGAPNAGMVASSGKGTPTRGGTLRCGLPTVGQSAALNPTLAVALNNGLAVAQIYEPLWAPSPTGGTPEPRLAESAEPNADATVWTIRLRDGVTWHDGKPLTADDVIYSLRYLSKSTGAAAAAATIAQLSQIRKRGKLVVEVPLRQPIANWPLILAQGWSASIIQDGATTESLQAKPVGTGPFKFVSSRAGRTTLAANGDYWVSGMPYLDGVVIDATFADDNTRLNALLSGQIDVMPQCSPLLLKQQIGSSKVTALGAPASICQGMFTMRVDQGELADVRVRQALRLAVDRQAIVDGALAGFGRPASDLFAPESEYFASDLKREQDVEQAKSLLKTAGRENVTLTLSVAPYGPQALPAATLLAQQAAEAGINIKIKTSSAATYFTAAGGYMTGVFRQNTHNPRPLEQEYLLFLSRTSPYNETRWGHQSGGEASWRLLDEALGATDTAKAEELWHTVQEQQFNEGGYLVWGYADAINLVANNVKGLTETVAAWLNNQTLHTAWIE
jgi:peptide/nickel transport system substrate-binding protein